MEEFSLSLTGAVLMGRISSFFISSWLEFYFVKAGWIVIFGWSPYGSTSLLKSTL